MESTVEQVGKVEETWLSPTPEMLKTPEFEAAWECIRTWDINVPEQYNGYCGATGNHVRAILDSLKAIEMRKALEEILITKPILCDGKPQGDYACDLHIQIAQEALRTQTSLVVTELA